MFIGNEVNLKHSPYHWLAMLFIAFSFIALNSCKKNPDGFILSSDYNNIADSATAMFDNGKPDKAVHNLESAFRRSKGLELLQIYRYYKLKYNYEYITKKDYAKAVLYTDSMITLFDTPQKKLKYTTEYGQAYFYKGDVLFDEGKYNDAYQFFYEGKIIGSNNFDECILGDYSYRMGMIMYKQDNYSVAAANFKNSFDETYACGTNFNYFYRRQELLNNTGLSYDKLNMPDSALYFYNKAIYYINNNFKNYKNSQRLLDIAKGVIFGNIANVYIGQKKYDQALELLKKSININLRKGNDNNDAQFAELKLARIYDQQNKNDSLYNTLKLIQAQFNTIKSNQALADWNYLMSNYYVKKNDHQKAVKHFMAYDAFKDSINLKNKTLKEADIAEQIRRLEKDNEFNILKKDNKLQNIYLKVAAVFAVMLIIIIFLTFINWQKSKKNIKTLGELNNQINDQNSHMEKALDELKLNGQEKDRILRTVAHDLRNPIGGIASLTVAMAGDDYTADQKELLNLIQETSYNSIELINEILEATNVASATLNKSLVEINSLLSHSVELLRFQAADKKQNIKLELLDDPRELLINREKIWRVVSNLISNAIKFSPPSSRILVYAMAKDSGVQISVTDFGIGIPDKLKNQVFNMFTDAKRPGTAGEKSFGLGLSICKQIVEKHDGRIWFESDTENGTTFYVWLPG